MEDFALLRKHATFWHPPIDMRLSIFDNLVKSLNVRKMLRISWVRGGSADRWNICWRHFSECTFNLSLAVLQTRPLELPLRVHNSSNPYILPQKPIFLLSQLNRIGVRDKRTIQLDIATENLGQGIDVIFSQIDVLPLPTKKKALKTSTGWRQTVNV